MRCALFFLLGLAGSAVAAPQVVTMQSLGNVRVRDVATVGWHGSAASGHGGGLAGNTIAEICLVPAARTRQGGREIRKTCEVGTARLSPSAMTSDILTIRSLRVGVFPAIIAAPWKSPVVPEQLPQAPCL
ncbi:MAG: hypothetical protein V4640_14135 [Verrucomicrobiota bacterium]